MKRFLVTVLIASCSAIFMAGCEGQEDVSGRQQLSPEVMKGRQEAAAKGGKSGGGAVLEPYDPLPPKDLQNKDISFGAKTKH